MRLKILIVGSWVSGVYEEPLYQALKNQHYDVHTFKWATFLNFDVGSNVYDTKKGVIKSIWYRLQNKFILGPSIFKINKSLVKRANSEKYDIVFLYRATHIWAKSVKSIKTTKAKIFIYNNDDPFTNNLPIYIYRHYKRTLPLADWIFAYRKKNITDYNKLGLKNSSLLLSSYINQSNYPIPNVNKDYDIIFIGHFENDGRDDAILELMKDSEIKVGLWGQNWAASKHYSFFCKYMKSDIKALFGSNYNQMINRSKVALIFFSKINNDDYTRRCFEIPAAKTMMLCEYSSQMASLFTENLEIEFFKSNDEIHGKLKRLLEDNTRIKNTSERAYQRLIQDKHEISDRAAQVISQFVSLSTRINP